MVKALILIGGKSSRLGTNKYLLNFHGVPQFRYLMSMLEKAGMDTYLSCNRRQNDKLPVELPRIQDHYDGIGPMGGVISAFEEFPKSSWLVIACDLPFVNTENILTILKARDRSCDVTTYRASENFYETTFTIYEPSIVKQLAEMRSSGKHSLQDVLKKSNIKAINPLNDIDMFNVNDKKDLAELSRLIKTRS